MGNLIDKVKQIWNNFANATKIRNNYKKNNTVKKRLKRVNFEILDCLLAIIGDSLAILIWPDEYNVYEIIGLIPLIIFLTWLLGYRHAIAFSKADRETYIEDSIKIIKGTFRILGKLIVAILIIVAVIIVLLILIINSGVLSEMFPNLKEVVESISVRLDGILGVF